MQKRPKYIPEPVWDSYQELMKPKPGAKSSLLDHPEFSEPIARLLGLRPDKDGDRGGVPEIAKTWRFLEREITKQNDPSFQKQDFRYLFDLFWTLLLTFDPGAYSNLRRCRVLRNEIVNDARKLALDLKEYVAISSPHGVSIPDELSELYWHIDKAEQKNPESWKRYRHPRRFGKPSFETYFPRPEEIIEKLADAFESADIHSNRNYANGREYPGMSAIVRHFDTRWSELQEPVMLSVPFSMSEIDEIANNVELFKELRPREIRPSKMKSRFTIGNTDLARILTALFEYEFSRELVRRARGQAIHPQPAGPGP